MDKNNIFINFEGEINNLEKDEELVNRTLPFIDNVDDIEMSTWMLLEELSDCNLRKEYLYKTFKLYTKRHNRFLYSIISKVVYDLDDESIENLLENTKKIKEECKRQKDTDNLNRVMKLYDHLGLAALQFKQLNTNEKLFNDRLDILENKMLNNIASTVASAKTYENHVEAEIAMATQEINNIRDNIFNQLISIVSIFTAISFVMFGGISLINNLFNFDTSAPIIELLCLGSLIGLVLINAIYIFLLFVLRITKCNFDKSHFQQSRNKINLIMGIILGITFTLWIMDNYQGWTFIAPILYSIGSSIMNLKLNALLIGLIIVLIVIIGCFGVITYRKIKSLQKEINILKIEKNSNDEAPL